MSALGLTGYSSSDSEDEDTRVNIGAISRKASLANTSVENTASDPHVRATADAPFVSPSFNTFGRAQKRFKLTQRGLPLFSTPIEAGDESDSDSEIQRYSRTGTNAVGKTGLSFLPEPVHTLPVHQPEQTYSQSSEALPSVDALPEETSEMYRVDVTPTCAVPASRRTKSATPEAVLSQSIRLCHHVEFKEIKAVDIQRAAPHEKSEIDGLRTAMGSEHAKNIQVTAAHHIPSKRQKQRHQLSSLYHKSQMTELQDMERKLTHTRSKAQTAAKYGW